MAAPKAPFESATSSTTDPAAEYRIDGIAGVSARSSGSPPFANSRTHVTGSPLRAGTHRTIELVLAQDDR
jgi:hypothetical protein